MQVNRISRYLILAILLIGITVRLINYFSNAGLWLDEALLSLNLMEKSFSQLLLPLDRDQVAPVLFLWIEKLSIIIFGPSELSLRLFPLICSLLSLPLFFVVARDLLDDEEAAIIALFIFAATPIQIRFSAEVKQYMTDVFVILLLIYLFGLFADNREKRRMIVFTISGVIAMFLSHIAVLVLFSLGILWFITDLLSKNRNSNKYIVFTFWLVTFGIYYHYFIDNQKNEPFMINYWKNNFLPLNPFSIEFWNFLITKGGKVFFEFMIYNHQGLPYQLNFIITLLLFIIYINGLIILFARRKVKTIFFLTFPVMVHLVLSGFRRYPFDTRLALYLSPLVIMAFSYGLVQVREFSNRLFNKRWPWVAMIVLVLLIFPYKLKVNFPFEMDGVRKSIDFINGHYKKDQIVYINYYSLAPFKYYSRTGKINISDALIFGMDNGKSTNWNEELIKFQDLNGEVWLLFSHLFPGNDALHENILEALKKRGRIRLSFFSKISAAYLIDLSN